MTSLKGFAAVKVILLAVSLFVYSNSFYCGYHLDDYHQIVNNPGIKNLGNIPKFFTDSSLETYVLNAKGYRPVTISSFALNYAASGDRVWSYHLLNFILHLSASIMVFLVVVEVINAAGGLAPYPIALAVSLIFAAHPIQTSAVTYISGRAALLSSLFYLVAFYGFLRSRAGGYRTWAFLSPVFFLAGLFSKELIISLPLAMLAYDFIFILPGRKGRETYGTLALTYVPYILAILFYFVVRKAAAGFFTSPAGVAGASEYLISELSAVPLYLRLVLLPFNQDADYAITPSGEMGAGVLAGALLLALALFMLWRQRAKKHAVAFFGLWSLIAIAPESSFIPTLDPVVEYRLYLPLAGLAAALITTGWGVIPYSSVRKASFAALLLLFCVLGFNRNTVWSTELSFWGDVVKKSPGSVRAHNNYGLALMDRKRFSEAVDEFGFCVSRQDCPEPGTIYNNMGLSYEGLGKQEQAASYYKKAIEASPDVMEARENLGAIFNRMGRYGEAVSVLEEAVRIDPGYTWTHYNLAGSYMRTGRARDALREAESAYKSSPKDFLTVYLLANVCKENGLAQRAGEYARLAVELSNDAGQREAALTLSGSLKKK